MWTSNPTFFIYVFAGGQRRPPLRPGRCRCRIRCRNRRQWPSFAFPNGLPCRRAVQSAESDCSHRQIRCCESNDPGNRARKRRGTVLCVKQKTRTFFRLNTQKPCQFNELSELSSSRQRTVPSCYVLLALAVSLTAFVCCLSTGGGQSLKNLKSCQFWAWLLIVSLSSYPAHRTAGKQSAMVSSITNTSKTMRGPRDIRSDKRL